MGGAVAWCSMPLPLASTTVVRLISKSSPFFSQLLAATTTKTLIVKHSSSLIRSFAGQSRNHPRSVLSCAWKKKKTNTSSSQPEDDDDDDGNTQLLRVILWTALGIYVIWLFLLPYAPGDPVWAISSDTINSLVGLSLNFFFILPLANSGTKQDK